MLNWNADALSLIDCGSKFGSLVQLKAPQSLNPEETLTIQCGRTVVELTVEKSWSLFSCFGAKHSRSKSKSDTKEENKTPPNECLPGAGRHSVLVVKKKAYNKLLNFDNTPKFKKPVLIQDNKAILMYKTPPPELSDNIRLNRQRTMAYNVKRKVNLMTFGNAIIRSHHGDTADDVKPEDF